MGQPRWGTIVVTAAICAAAAFAAARPARVMAAQEASAPKSPFDFQTYRERVEPIFLKQRGEHARCYACHSQNGSAFHLQRLMPGQATWTEEQSRMNFQSVSRIAVPGDPGASRLLLHPLAPEAGGNSFHSGGRQFEDENDPDWKTIADWVRAGKK